MIRQKFKRIEALKKHKKEERGSLDMKKSGQQISLNQKAPGEGVRTMDAENRNQNRKILKIVLTGGPCSGKSASLERIAEHFEKEGWTVLQVPETATQLMQSGLSPSSCRSIADFQRAVFRMQKEKEDFYSDSVEYFSEDRFLIVFDRGLMDGKSYLPEADFETILKENRLTEPEILNRYDAIIHLESTASRFPEYYTLSTNSVRLENDPAEAAEAEQKTEKVWEQHPDYHFIKARPDFEQKMDELVQTIQKIAQSETESKQDSE